MNYLSRALVLGDSLQEFAPNSPFIVFCHDDETQIIANLNKSSNTVLIHLKDVILQFPELTISKSNRSHIEFLYSLTPFIMKYTLEVLDFQRCVYVDADECFFNNLDVILQEPGKSEMAITGHNFTSGLKHLETRGKYNVGIVYAKAGGNSDLILNWWAKQCIVSTSIDMSDRLVFGDQMYLDSFRALYPDTHLYEDTGINAAPWNLSGKKLLRKSMVAIPSRIVCFHFSGLIVGKYFYLAGFHKYGNYLPRKIRKAIFEPYVRKLVEKEFLIRGTNAPYMLISPRNVLRGVIFRDLHLRLHFNRKN